MRIAIVGAGPTGFFLAKSLLDQGGEDWRVDIFEKTPFPFGLVRFGVAPDHPKIKSVTKGFSKVLADSRCHFWGGVKVAERDHGGDFSVESLLEHYHSVALTVGSQDDRKLGIPQEESKNSFPATRFVGWYNAHPEDLGLNPNLKVERAAVVGAGNVAIDILRLLISLPERLAPTDISDQALEQLRASSIKEVDVLVRRGPWDVAFTNPEVKELLDFEDVQFTFDPPLAEFFETPPYADRRATNNMAIFLELEARTVAAPRATVHFRFLVSPRELEVSSNGAVQGIQLGHNTLVVNDEGSKLSDSGRTSTLPSGLFLRSVGYLGRPLHGVSYCDRRGVIPADAEGRVVDAMEQPVSGLYVSGWMRRGPSGVIGTNKKDANEVAQAIIADGAVRPVGSDAQFEEWLASSIHQKAISKSDWEHIDAREIALGQANGRPRRKFLSATEVAQELSSRVSEVLGAS